MVPLVVSLIRCVQAQQMKDIQDSQKPKNERVRDFGPVQKGNSNLRNERTMLGAWRLKQQSKAGQGCHHGCYPPSRYKYLSIRSDQRRDGSSETKPLAWEECGQHEDAFPSSVATRACLEKPVSLADTRRVGGGVVAGFAAPRPWRAELEFTMNFPSVEQSIDDAHRSAYDAVARKIDGERLELNSDSRGYRCGEYTFPRCGWGSETCRPGRGPGAGMPWAGTRPDNPTTIAGSIGYTCTHVRVEHHKFRYPQRK